MTNRPFRRALRLSACLALAAGAALLPGCGKNRIAARDTANRTLTAEQIQRNVDSFDYVWQTINDKHFDPTFNGADWNAAREIYRPQVEAATTMAQARNAMNAAIGMLNQSHFGIIPSDAYADLAPESSTPSADAPSSSEAGATKEAAAILNRDGSLGMHVRVADDQALVWMLRAGMPAEQAGVRPGSIITKIDGESLAPIISRIAKTDHPNLVDMFTVRAIESRLNGPVGSDVAIEFKDERNRTVTKTITRAQPDGTPATFGNLPKMHVTFDKGEIRNTNVGYIALNLFFDATRIMPELRTAVEELSGTDGIILDLRGNPGGLGGMAMGFAGWFVSEPDLKLGTMSTRESNLNFIINPQAEPYTGPLAILVDGLTASTAEILAGGLQDLGRARVFGSRTAGAALPSQITMLPNGDGFQFAFANYVSTGGKALEGHGVTPDEIVPLDRPTLLLDEDPVINAAVRWIQSRPR